MVGPGKVRHLLVVDDDTHQSTLFKYLLAELNCEYQCHCVASGAEAVAFLRLASPHQNAPKPELIVLDLNMPGMDGCETLQVIKSDPEFRRIPVIMFSNSSNEDDVTRCYYQHANAYVRKPLDLESGLRIVQQIEDFWLNTVVLPA